jgi:hypothetical protein
MLVHIINRGLVEAEPKVYHLPLMVYASRGRSNDRCIGVSQDFSLTRQKDPTGDLQHGPCCTSPSPVYSSHPQLPVRRVSACVQNEMLKASRHYFGRPSALWSCDSIVEISKAYNMGKPNNTYLGVDSSLELLDLVLRQVLAQLATTIYGSLRFANFRTWTSPRT